MAATHNGQNGDIGFQIAPMVDVVFVLLLFFMACAGFSEKFLSVPVPGARGDGQISIFVDIDASGNVSVNGTVLATGGSETNLPRLREFLGRAMQAAPEDQVVIRPGDEARHENVVAVVNACRAMHVRKLAFR
jgi:biopolymer transport protein ExbD